MPDDISGARPTGTEQGGLQSDPASVPAPFQLTPEVERLIDQKADEKAQLRANSIMKEHRLSFQKENATLKEQIDQMNGELSSFKQFITELATEPTPDPQDELERQTRPPSWVKDEQTRRTWTELNKRMYEDRVQLTGVQKKISELTAELDKERTELAAERKQREEIQLARLHAEKRAELARLSTDIDAVHPEAVYRHFNDDVIFDEKKQAWNLRTPDGELVPLKQGLEKFLPDYLRKPAITNGGTGSQGNRGQEAPATLLKNAEAAVEAAHQRAQLQPNPRNVHEYQKAERLLREVKQQQSTA